MGRRGKKKFHGKWPISIKDSNPTMGGGSSSAPPPPWIELPRELTVNILNRLGPVEILENAQKVCTTWRSICGESSLWRVIDMKNSGEGGYETLHLLNIVCRHAVDRSRGELIDINIEYFGTDDLLHYISISQRSGSLKCLRLESCDGISGEGLTTSVKSFPELEELHLIFMPHITAEDMENISISCPNLKSFTFKRNNYTFETFEIDDSCAFSIANNMPNLQHLCLTGNKLSNEGLKAILNGCPNLESLDLYKCYGVDLARYVLSG